MDTLSSGCLSTEIKLRCIPLSVSTVSGFVPYLGFSLSALPGQRGVTPAFGYDTPHPGARGTLTLLISALPSAHYGQLRLPCRPSETSSPYIHQLPSCRASTRVSRVHSRMASPACHPCYLGSPSIGSGSFRQDRCAGLPHCRKGSTTPSCVSRLHLGSLALRPAGLFNSLTEPLSGNLMLQVTPYTSLKLRGRTTELPRSDFNRQVIRFTRHTLRVHRYSKVVQLTIMS
jgi:hypothetical protein